MVPRAKGRTSEAQILKGSPLPSLGLRSAGVAVLGAHNDSALRCSARLEVASSYCTNEAQESPTRAG